MCIYMNYLGSYVEMFLECTMIRPSRAREGLGCDFVDQILTSRFLVYVYICGLPRFIC